MKPRFEKPSRACPKPNLALGIGLVLLAATRGAVAAGEGNTDTTAASNRNPVGEVAPAKTNESDSESSNGLTADVSLIEEYRLRIASHSLPSAGALSDPASANQQVDQRLRLLGDAQVLGAEEHFRAVASGALWMDLDGKANRTSAAVFATQYDNANPWVAAYALSAEWRKDKALDHLRVGRQSTEHGMPLTFDGASLGLRLLERRLLLFGFGGRTVHFFETKPGLFENWVGSAGAVLRPTLGTAFEFDTRLIQEQTLNADRSQRDRLTNHSYGLSAALRSDSIYSKFYGRGIDSKLSHAGGAFQYHNEGWKFGLDARLNAQLVKLGEVVESENPFFSLLGPSLPNLRFRFEAWKDFAVGAQSNMSFHLGWRGRQLVGYSEQAFNRNTGAFYLHSRLDDLMVRGFFVGAMAEYSYVPRSLLREWLLTFGGATGYSRGNFKMEMGSYFQQYKINYYQQAEELHNARTYYGSISYRLATWLEARARYEIDIIDRYLQSFFLSMRQDF